MSKSHSGKAKDGDPNHEENPDLSQSTSTGSDILAPVFPPKVVYQQRHTMMEIMSILPPVIALMRRYTALRTIMNSRSARERQVGYLPGQRQTRSRKYSQRASTGSMVSGQLFANTRLFFFFLFLFFFIRPQG